MNQTHVPDTVFYNPAEQQKLTPALLLLLSLSLRLRLLVCSGANPKKPSAPDMFTESDDLFAADFDVSTRGGGGGFAIRNEPETRGF